MTQQVMLALGGLGLFLFGMVVMTDGLNRLAGPALHRWLVSFTRSPVTGAVTGTVATAVLQSSSATTVATVGFVAAGLLTFTQALGIVFGANLGTTITGWLVALFGFKLELGQLALPGVLIGALLSLLGRGHWQTLGRVIAGFAVLFLGIEFMKDGMAVFGDLLTPSRFPPDHLGSRLLLVGLGALLTLLTQSSSAGVALAMTALSLGSLNFAQAACLVIGMDVGTTITAVLASIGRSAAAWRTGLSHTIYNVATAVIALALLDAYVFGLDTLLPGALQDDQELALVGFHTLFNAVALVFGLLLARPFSRFMAWLVPVRTQDLTWRLDDALLAEPAAANAALAATLADVFHRLLSWQRHALGPAGDSPYAGAEPLDRDLSDIRLYLDRLNALPEPSAPALSTASALHTLDHLQRMVMRLNQEGRLGVLRHLDELASERSALVEVAETLLHELPGTPSGTVCEQARRLDQHLFEGADRYRHRVIEQAAQRDLDAAQTGERLAAHRWLERMAHHQWRVAAHLAGLDSEEGSLD